MKRRDAANLPPLQRLLFRGNVGSVKYVSKKRGRENLRERRSEVEPEVMEEEEEWLVGVHVDVGGLSGSVWFD